MQCMQARSQVRQRHFSKSQWHAYSVKNYSKRHIVVNLRQTPLPCSELVYPTVLATSWSSCQENHIFWVSVCAAVTVSASWINSKHSLSWSGWLWGRDRVTQCQIWWNREMRHDAVFLPTDLVGWHFGSSTPHIFDHTSERHSWKRTSRLLQKEARRVGWVCSKWEGSLTRCLSL